MPVLCYVIHPLTQTNTALWVIVDVAMVLGGLGAGAGGNNKIWSPKFKALPSYSSPPSHMSHTTNSYCTRYLVCNVATDSSYRGAQTYILQEKGKHSSVMGNECSLLPLPYNVDIADEKLQIRNTQNSDTLSLQTECKPYMQRAIHVMHKSFNLHSLPHTPNWSHPTYVYVHKLLVNNEYSCNNQSQTMSTPAKYWQQSITNMWRC